MTTTQFTGAVPQQSASRMISASDGKARIDMPNTSVITDPQAQKAIVLDHITKQATILPMAPTLPQMPQMPGAPQIPGMPQPPQMPAVSAQDLGKSLIEGHPVDGIRYTIQPPQLPQAPQMPQPPQMPQVPGMPQPPQMPQMPQLPQKPQMPTVADVWTSTQLKVPVLTKVSGPFGDQTCYCKPAQIAEPDPSMFQIPPGYTPVMPKPK